MTNSSINVHTTQFLSFDSNTTAKNCRRFEDAGGCREKMGTTVILKQICTRVINRKVHTACKL